MDTKTFVCLATTSLTSTPISTHTTDRTDVPVYAGSLTSRAFGVV